MSNKQCIMEMENRQKCPRMARFGFIGERPKYCSIHRKPDMIDIINKINIGGDNINR